MASKSRDAAKDCSPGRKPWVRGVGASQAPVGAKEAATSVCTVFAQARNPTTD
jgi:hypothetical protein